MKTKVYCILSDERVYRSRSPLMFSRVLDRVGIKGAYVPFCVHPGDLGQALQSLRCLHIAGANVTVPYKEKVIPHLDVLSEGANIIGAINTIVCKGDELKGYNTNAIGIMDALGSIDFEVAGKSAVVFGTGGAARTVVFILNWLRAGSITLVGRNWESAGAITSQFGGRPMKLEKVDATRLSADVVINATAVSSPVEAPDFHRLVKDLQVPGCRLVFDLNYGREENFWRDLAGNRHARFMDGLPALAYQARRTFALWTGVQVAPEEFIQALA